MKINISKRPGKALSSVKPGSLFVLRTRTGRESVYMKTAEGAVTSAYPEKKITAVCLSTGCLFYFNDVMIVIEVEGELNISQN